MEFSRMSREDALEFMQKHLITSPDQLLVEIDRYITTPGQACAYKIGEQKILELRKFAQGVQGHLIIFFSYKPILIAFVIKCKFSAIFKENRLISKSFMTSF